METARDESLSSTLWRLGSRLPILLVLSWMVLYLYRPFVLGVYIDDWWEMMEPIRTTAPFSMDRFHYYVGLGTNHGSRPVKNLIGFLVTSIAGPSPAAIQFLSTLLVLAAALSLRAWLNGVMSVFPQYRNIAGDFAAIFWMALPWMMGATAWPTNAQTLGAQILFTETARLLLARERATAGVAALVAAGITASGLVYEGFYFAIFPVVLFYAACGRGPARSKRDTAVLLGICACAQAIPIAFNRLLPHDLAVNKAFNPRWPEYMLGNILGLPNTLLKSFREYQFPGLALAAAVAVCAAILWNPGWRSEAQRLLCRYLLGLIGVAMAACLFAIAVYSAAGYGFDSLGPGSRSLLAPSLWFATTFFALICCVFVSGPRSAQAGLVTAAVALVVVLARAEHDRVMEWAFAWREEVRILQSAPMEELARVAPDAAVFYVGSPEHRGVATFVAPWDLTAAVSSRRVSNEKRRPHEGMTRIYPATGSHWTWDGMKLVRSSPLGTEMFQAKQLYLWRDGVAGLAPVEPGFRWPPPGGGEGGNNPPGP